MRVKRKNFISIKLRFQSNSENDRPCPIHMSVCFLNISSTCGEAFHVSLTETSLVLYLFHQTLSNLPLIININIPISNIRLNFNELIVLLCYFICALSLLGLKLLW
jgi:hypothetical protein